MTPLITLEEHYLSPRIRSASNDNPNTKDHYTLFPPSLLSKLESLGPSRIADMNNSDISMQILSHGPVPPNLPTPLYTLANNDLATAISQFPNRLAGFATLPMREPLLAAQELERCVKELGFVGALIECHVEGRFYDEEVFWPVFERAEGLGVPLYLHPSFASEEMMGRYRGNYSETTAISLSAFGWGWHSATGLHILRLFASGLFDRFPSLKLIIGHMGELLPFQFERLVAASTLWTGPRPRERGFREVWRENIWITTSGMFDLAPLACLLSTTTPDHVLFSVDYPFSGCEKGRKFVEEVRESGLFGGEGEFAGWASGNAERLLGVSVKRGEGNGVGLSEDAMK